MASILPFPLLLATLALRRLRVRRGGRPPASDGPARRTAGAVTLSAPRRRRQRPTPRRSSARS